LNNITSSYCYFLCHGIIILLSQKYLNILPKLFLLLKTERNFKNVIAILDNDFGNLRIIKDNNNVYINDVDLTNSAKNLY
jgi:hypothetical protein